MPKSSTLVPGPTEPSTKTSEYPLTNARVSVEPGETMIEAFLSCGSVLLNRPLNYKIWMCICGILLLGLLCILIFVTYAEQYTVNGIVDANPGIVNVYVPYAGVMTQSNIHIGQQVQLGDVLFYMQSAQVSSPMTRTILLKMQHAINHAIYQQQAQLSRLKPLWQHKQVTLATYQQVVDSIRSLVNQRDHLSITLETEQQKQKLAITSPINGKIMHIEYQTGQFLPINKAIISILPQGATWRVLLYVPVTAWRFLQSPQDVILRYDAYPYTQFGIDHGKIEWISHNVLHSTNKFNFTQAYYKVSVHLNTSGFWFAQHMYPLHQGMTVTASLIGEAQALGRWMLHRRHT